jgi:APA family basic amino acid/polyamine antiporter
MLYLLAGTSIQLLLPPDVVVNSPAPFADAMVSRWGHGVASFAALAIAISAFGCLNGLILATGELGYGMALRGDLPAIMARTRGANTPYVAQLVVAGLTVLLLLANSSRAMANLYTFIVLLSTAGGLVLYCISSLAAWRLSPTTGARAIILIALLFIAYATFGVGLEAVLWCLVLLAAGLAIRAAVRRLSSRAPSPVPAAAPVAPPGSSS